MNILMEIIVFAILAGYLFLRLWNVLGSRTGFEKKVDPFAADNLKASSEDNVVIMPSRGPKVEPVEEALQVLSKQINKLQEADEKFDPYVFLRSAKSAFEIIIKAFAEANHSTLKKLLSTEVYENFSSAIEERDKKGQRQETEIDKLEAQIKSININSDKASITVEYISDQMMATFDAEGRSFDNPSRLYVTMLDNWTFEKKLGSDEQIWLLTRTWSKRV